MSDHVSRQIPPFGEPMTITTARHDCAGSAGTPACQPPWHFLTWISERRARCMRSALRALAMTGQMRIGERRRATLVPSAEDGDLVDVWTYGHHLLPGSQPEEIVRQPDLSTFWLRVAALEAAARREED